MILKKIFKGDQYELAFVCSEYGSATDEVNAQLAEIDKIVKKYDNTAMVIGEAPLMKDLQDTTDADLVRVNVISIGAIFLIIMIIFKSISLRSFWVALMSLRFLLLSLQIFGAIQLGATVDYAILMTTRYQRERQHCKNKMTISNISLPSIISSGLSRSDLVIGAIHRLGCHQQFYLAIPSIN